MSASFTEATNHSNWLNRHLLNGFGDPTRTFPCSCNQSYRKSSLRVQNQDVCSRPWLRYFSRTLKPKPLGVNVCVCVTLQVFVAITSYWISVSQSNDFVSPNERIRLKIYNRKRWQMSLNVVMYKVFIRKISPNATMLPCCSYKFVSSH